MSSVVEEHFSHCESAFGLSGIFGLHHRKESVVEE